MQMRLMCLGIHSSGSGFYSERFGGSNGIQSEPLMAFRSNKKHREREHKQGEQQREMEMRAPR